MPIPTKTDESIGRVKVDRPAVFPRVVDPRYETSAAEYERLKDAVIANATDIASIVGGAVEELAGATYTLEATDNVKVFLATAGGGLTLTVPDDELPVGFKCWVYRLGGAVTLSAAGALSLAAIGEYESTPIAARGVGARLALEAIATGAGTSVVRVGGELERAADFADQIGALPAGAGALTLAELNAALSDATLDDVGDPRDPTAHAASHAPSGSDPLGTAAPISLAIGAAGNEGNAQTFARSNHEHNFPAPPAPTAVARANATGDDTTVARSDHVHDGGVAAVDDFDDTASPITLATTHEILTLDTVGGSIEIDLPAPASAGKRTWTLIQRGGDAATDIVLDPNGAESINGVAANFTLPGSDADGFRAWLLVCDGANWFVV